MDPRQVFGDADLAAIRDAASAAERDSAGEVVPYIVGRSHDYPEAAWLAAVIGAVAASALVAIADVWLGPWGRQGAFWIALPPLVGAAAGYAAGRRVPAVVRWLVPDSVMASHARLRAQAAFVEEAVFDTRDHSGVLLLVSLLEHQAVVLADAGAQAVAVPEEWAGIVDTLTAGMHAGQPTSAMVDAIAASARILQRLPARPRDSNELRDAVRMRDE